MGFIDTMHSDGHAVESVRPVAARTLSDAQVADLVGDLA
jgi:hypothetical protein